MRFLLAASLPVLLGPPISAAPFIVAHRGASHDAPENTLPAFELAWKQGADAIEADFHLTSDGKLVCIHDADIKRVTGVSKIVAKSTLDELRALDAGAWFKPEWKGTRLPTFAEVASTVPPAGKFYVEIKSGPETARVLVREMGRTKLKPTQVVIISFDKAAIAASKKLAPDIRAFWLSSFRDTGPLDPSADGVLATLREIKADGFSSKADKRIDAAFVARIRDGGFEYHCWTIDDPKVARKFLGLGAGSVTTNRPGVLRARLAD
ncbi:MAG: glycerophosphodiester phosphodiesterase [Verrucomicrobia bacterium]|nr:glycerophosphodiester phosphodiesterase [Verrucomicrobiota bacterium]